MKQAVVNIKSLRKFWEMESQSSSIVCRLVGIYLAGAPVKNLAASACEPDDIIS